MDNCRHQDVEDSVCLACGQCVHDVVLNGACFHCGETDLEVMVKPGPELIPPGRLVRGS